MKKSIYTIIDEKACSIGPLFTAMSDDEAKRMVRVSASKADSLMTEYPADFALLRLGDIDLSDGTITGKVVPVLVAKIDDVIKA